MKRKIFSKLLMGAFLIASVSSFVSCKDYDDDINNLQKQIDAAALKAELTTLQQTLAAQIQEAKSAAQAAQAAAEAAQRTADNAATKDALEAVKTAATNAGTAAAQAIADAANAQVAANAAQTTANNAGTAAEKAAADAAKAIADAAAAQNTANVAQTAAAAAQKAAEVAQTAADGANSNAAKALADAASALSAASAAQTTANAAQTTANAADAAAKEAKATADQAIAAAGNAATQAAEAVAAANAAKVAAAEAKYDDSAIKALVDNANKYAEAAAKDAKEAAEKAAAAVADAAAAKKTSEDNINAAIEAATKAINESKDAIVTAAVAEAVKKIGEIPADQSEAVSKLTEDLKKLSGAQADLATKEGLAKEVETLNKKIESATLSEEQLAEIAAATGTIKDALDVFMTAITCVELFVPYGNEPYFDNELNFIWAKELGTYNFGNEIKLNASKTGLVEGDKIIDQDVIGFKEGEYNVATDSIMIRVSPMKAEITPDQIALVNTQGDTISSDYIKITSVKRYERLLTRAQSIDVGGLWVVKFAVDKDNIKKWVEAAPKASYMGMLVDAKKVAAELLKQTWTYNTNYQSADQKIYFDRQIRFALAVKHTADDTPRRIVTEHEVTIDAPEAIPYYDDFVVRVYQQGKYEKDGSRSVEEYWCDDLHNRFTLTEDGTYTTPEVILHMDKPAGLDFGYELNWNYWKNINNVKYRTPTTLEKVKIADWTANNYTGKSDTENAQYRYNEGRQAQEPAYIQIGEDIEIDFTVDPTSKPGFNWALPANERIKGFYVALDKPYALESQATELQAWGTYEYADVNDQNSVATFNVDGSINQVAKYFDGPKGIIRLSHSNDKVMAGEYIGFRVFAVNFDGTLVDPDGRAFYVRVGDPSETHTAHDAAPQKGLSITATSGTGLTVSDAIAIPNGFFKTTVDRWGWLPYNANQKAFSGVSGSRKYSQPFTITFYSDAAGTTPTTWIPNAKSYRISYQASELVDNQTYNVSLYTMYTKNVHYGTQDTLQIVDFAFKKTLPTALPEKAKLVLQNGVDPDNDKIVTQYIAQHNVNVAPAALPAGYAFYAGYPATVETATFDFTKVFKQNDPVEDAKLTLYIESTDSLYATDNTNKKITDGFSTKELAAGTYAALLATGTYPINSTAAIDGNTQHAVKATYADYANIKRASDGKLSDLGKLDTGYKLIYADWSDAFDFANVSYGHYLKQPAYTGALITKPVKASLDPVYGSLAPTITFAQSAWNTYPQYDENGVATAGLAHDINWTDMFAKNIGNYANGATFNVSAVNINKFFKTKELSTTSTSADIEIDEELTLYEVGVYADAAGTQKSELYDLTAPVTVADIAAGNAITLKFIGNPSLKFEIAKTQYIVVKALTRYSLDAAWKSWDVKGKNDTPAFTYFWKANDPTLNPATTGTTADIWKYTGRHVTVALPFTIIPVK